VVLELQHNRTPAAPAVSVLAFVHTYACSEVCAACMLAALHPVLTAAGQAYPCMLRVVLTVCPTARALLQ
jgi:hypothetical protein